MGTFFANVDPKFSPVPDDKMIQAEPFLKAARQMIPFIELLGTPFKPIKNDIEGNIVKLQNKLNFKRDTFVTFYAMLQDDIQTKDTKTASSATISLLWLKRALHFIVIFLQQIVDDHHTGTKSENMVPFCKHAYEESLKKYHGWVVQKIFLMVTRAVPYRKDFLRTLAYGKDCKEAEVVADMEKFTVVLAPNLEVIQQMYLDLNLDFQDKV